MNEDKAGGGGEFADEPAPPRTITGKIDILEISVNAEPSPFGGSIEVMPKRVVCAVCGLEAGTCGHSPGLVTEAAE